MPHILIIQMHQKKPFKTVAYENKERDGGYFFYLQCAHQLLQF